MPIQVSSGTQAKVHLPAGSVHLPQQSGQVTVPVTGGIPMSAEVSIPVSGGRYIVQPISRCESK